MSLIPRTAQPILKKLAKSYPAVIVTGPRQSGKTTLTQTVFPNKSYVSLEDLDTREFATQDPRGFLNQYPDGAILDEVQRCPDLFCYLQSRLDATKKMGTFILTGSQQFGLLSGVSQSLAGRPFSPSAFTNCRRPSSPPKHSKICYSKAFTHQFMIADWNHPLGMTITWAPTSSVMSGN